MKQRAYGFTIVELLIVIVVIAILAALSYVGYTSISSRANDSAVKSDLANIAKMIQQDAVVRGGYVPGGSGPVSDSTQFPGIKFAVAKDSYLTGPGTNNMSYCTGLINSESVFRVEGRSKSGRTFRYSSNAGLQDLGNVVSGPSQACDGLTSTTFSYGYYGAQDRWWSWTNG